MRFLCALIVAVVVLAGPACPGTTAPVDTSQAILVEVGAVVAEVDEVVAVAVTTAGEQVRARVQDEVDLTVTIREDCLLQVGDYQEAAEVCPRAPDPMALYREAMATWGRLVAVLASTVAVLRAWEAANDGWRSSGRPPEKWEDMVCQPVRIVVDQLRALLPQLDLAVPPSLPRVAARVPVLCSLGAAVGAALAGPGDGGGL